VALLPVCDFLSGNGSSILIGGGRVLGVDANMGGEDRTGPQTTRGQAMKIEIEYCGA
jgi:hypothetical protein